MNPSKQRLTEADHQIDPFAGAKDGFFERRLQKRFVEYASVVAAAAVCVGYGFLVIASELDVVRNIAFILSFAGFVGAFLVSRLSGNVRLGALLLTVTGLAITLLPSFLDGGLHSPYVIWFVFVPLIAGLLIGPRLASITGLSGLLAVILMTVFVELLPTDSGVTHSTGLMALNLMLAILFCIFMGWFLAVTLERYRQQVGDALAAMQEKNAALIESNDRFASSLRLSKDAIVIIDREAKILIFNPAAENMFGLSADEAIGQSMPDKLIPPRLRNAHKKGFENYLQTGEASILGTTIETQSLRADGSEFPVELTVQEIINDQEPHFIAYISDLTEQKNLQHELESQARKIDHKVRLESIGTLAGGIAHDFNNLLMIIKGYTEMLVVRPDLADAARQQVREIDRASDKARDITRQLLTFSRTDNGTKGHVDLVEVIDKLVGMLNRILPDTIALETELETGLWLVRSERVRLDQALMNLILNAVYAMPDGGVISLTAGNVVLEAAEALKIGDLDPGDYCRIRVRDEGTGMDSETMRHVFEPYYTSKPAGEGSGLGLFVTYGIVEASGGAITVMSQPGVGSTFTIYLPRSDVRRTVAQASSSSGSNKQGDNETILVVEDEAAIRKLQVEALLRAGYQVVEAADGERGYELALAHAGEIQLIISDLNMPKLTGEAMMRRLRLAGQNVKVIFVSGNAQDMIEIENEDTERLIHKPFSLKVLTDTVRDLLDR